MTVIDHNMPATWAQTLTRPLTAALQNPWVESIVRLSAVEDSLKALHPMLSLSTVRARVVRIEQETADTKTFVLQPNALWSGALAGQFVRLRLEIKGRQVERVYSLSSRPGARRIAITVKRQPGGLVSNHLHGHTQVGDVLTLSQAAGDFVLPPQLPAKILLLSAGSGITPVMALLRDLQARRYTGDLVFFHACRAPADAIFAQKLDEMASNFPSLKRITHFTATSARLTPETLRWAVPDLAERTTWMCGPSAFMEAVHGLWQDAAIAAPLHSERFATTPLLPASTPGTSVKVRCATSARDFNTQGGDVLLVQAERAGLTPKHGCRIGICRSCQCTKTSGTVENLQTGEVSSAPNELIRLCISAARSDLTLDL